MFKGFARVRFSLFPKRRLHNLEKLKASRGWVERKTPASLSGLFKLTRPEDDSEQFGHALHGVGVSGYSQADTSSCVSVCGCYQIPTVGNSGRGSVYFAWFLKVLCSLVLWEQTLATGVGSTDCSPLDG